MGIGNRCFVAGAFCTGPRRFCLASVLAEDPCCCLLGQEIKRKLQFVHLQMYSSLEGFVHGASVLDSSLRP